MTTLPTEVVFFDTKGAQQGDWAWLVLNGGYRLYLGPDNKIHAHRLLWTDATPEA